MIEIGSPFVATRWASGFDAAFGFGFTDGFAFAAGFASVVVTFFTRAFAEAAVFLATAGASDALTFLEGSAGSGVEEDTVSCDPPMTKSAPPITNATSTPRSAKTLMAGLTVRATEFVSAERTAA